LARIGRLEIGRGPAKVMGIINASPESFYKGSVKTEARDIAAAAKAMQEAGAHIIDIGGMSTAPYLETVISVDEELRRIENAISAAKSACDLPVSIDTPRAEVAQAAIKLGVDAINDVTGLKYDRRMAAVVVKSGLPVIIGAYSKKPATGKLAGTVRALKESVALARKAGVKKDAIIVDPSIGFFRAEGKNPFFTKMTDVPWYSRDLEVLANLRTLAKIAPVCVSVSRKSFLGHLFGVKADERLIPSIACEVVAAMNGAGIIRTHSVKETVQALVMQELLAR
jgi:dihydropteroate synthase